jgi:hypothetical protein
MVLQQQATLTNHAAQHQRGTSNSWRELAQFNKNGGGGGSRGYQQLAYQQPGAMGQRLDYTPTPYKCLENWNYCHTHGGNVNNGHTSRMCAKPGPMHTPPVKRTNMMNGSATSLHKTILPSASGRVPHVPCQQCPPAPAT